MSTKWRANQTGCSPDALRIGNAVSGVKPSGSAVTGVPKGGPNRQGYQQHGEESFESVGNDSMDDGRVPFGSDQVSGHPPGSRQTKNTEY